MESSFWGSPGPVACMPHPSSLLGFRSRQQGLILALKKEKSRPSPEREQAGRHSADLLGLAVGLPIPGQHIILLQLLCKGKPQDYFAGGRKIGLEKLWPHFRQAPFSGYRNLHKWFPITPPLSLQHDSPAASLQCSLCCFSVQISQKKNQIWSEQENKPHDPRRPKCLFFIAPPEMNQRESDE